jgi:hypothetical protein
MNAAHGPFFSLVDDSANRPKMTTQKCVLTKTAHKQTRRKRRRRGKIRKEAKTNGCEKSMITRRKSEANIKRSIEEEEGALNSEVRRDPRPQ